MINIGFSFKPVIIKNSVEYLPHIGLKLNPSDCLPTSTMIVVLNCGAHTIVYIHDVKYSRSNLEGKKKGGGELQCRDRHNLQKFAQMQTCNINNVYAHQDACIKSIIKV